MEAESDSSTDADRLPYRVLVPVSDNEASADAQARFVAGLPNAAGGVEATVTHVLHGEELETSRDARSAQRVATVQAVRDALRNEGVAVRVVDVDHPSPPTKGILALAERIDGDLVVLGGGMHGLLDDLFTGRVVTSVGRRTDRPVAVIRPAPGESDTDESTDSPR